MKRIVLLITLCFVLTSVDAKPYRDTLICIFNIEHIYVEKNKVDLCIGKVTKRVKVEPSSMMKLLTDNGTVYMIINRRGRVVKLIMK